MMLSKVGLANLGMWVRAINTVEGIPSPKALIGAWHDAL